ncbi:MAG: low molecular weight phosphotyrosine protein phosphatase [Bacteroidaceae bacterium]|nr:low molecular weight phosphotyrosine protein phosphatase [Bacteroidaceae bacterium]
MAEFVMKQKVAQAGVSHRFHIESAATSSEELGNPVYPPVRELMRRLGIPFDRDKRARKLLASDYDDFDHIIGMDEYNRRNMQRICMCDYDGKISLLMDFTAHPRSVADPWYTDEYEKAWRDIDEGCDALLRHLLAQIRH